MTAQTIDPVEAPVPSNDEEGWLRPLLHIVVLSGFAVAQPLFDLLGRHVVFLVAHRASRLEVLLLVGAIAVVLPAVLFLIEVSIGLVSAQARRAVHVVFVGLLFSIALLPAVNRFLPLPGVAFPTFVGLGALLLGAAYVKFRRLRQVLTVLWPAPLLFSGILLFATPVSQLLLPSTHAHASVARIAPSRVPVVVVVFDELPIASLLAPDGMIDEQRFPNFGRLASRSNWYRNATAVHPTTRFSVPSILTGRYARSAVPITSEYPRNLFTMLEKSHRHDVWEIVTQLCPRDLCVGRTDAAAQDEDSPITTILEDVGILYLHTILPTDWRNAVPPVDQQWTHFADQAATEGRTDSVSSPSDAEVDLDAEQAEVRARFREAQGADHTRRFQQFVDGIQAAVQPSVHYVHVMLPHRPFQYVPSGHRYVHEPSPGEDPDRKNYWLPDEYLVTQMQQRHLLQVGHVDALLGRLLDKLEAEGIFDDALVVVTADHGISFDLDAPDRVLVPENAAAVVGVPLFIKLPGQEEGVVDDRNVELIDILPTVADALGIESGWDIDGRSLLGDTPVRDDEKLVIHLGEKFTLPGSLLRDLLAIAQQTHATFGPFKADFDLMGAGPHASLLAQPVADLVQAEPSEMTARINDLAAFAEVDPLGELLPTRLVGTVDLGASRAAPVSLAVVVNGVVAGVGRTYFHDGATAHLSILTPDDLLRRGRNDVRLYEISSDRSLREIAVRGS